MIEQINLNNRPSPYFALRIMKRVTPFPDPSTVFYPEENPPCNCSDDIEPIPVFGNVANASDTYTNDFTTVIFEQTLSNTGIAMFLDSWGNTGWTQKAILNDNALGTLYNYGDLGNPKLTGYTLRWRNVLVAVGAGTGFYRIRMVQTGTGAGVWYSNVFCLQQFHKWRANGTCRYDWTVKGTRTSVMNKDVELDYGDNPIPFQIRAKGEFGFENNENERIEYKNDDKTIRQGRVKVHVKYEFACGLLSWRTQYALAYNAFISDTLFATDYCVLNDNENYKSVPIIHNDNYKPEFYVYNKHHRVTIEFKDRIDNKGNQIC